MKLWMQILSIFWYVYIMLLCISPYEIYKKIKKSRWSILKFVLYHEQIYPWLRLWSDDFNRTSR